MEWDEKIYNGHAYLIYERLSFIVTRDHYICIHSGYYTNIIIVKQWYYCRYVMVFSPSQCFSSDRSPQSSSVSHTKAMGIHMLLSHWNWSSWRHTLPTCNITSPWSPTQQNLELRKFICCTFTHKAFCKYQQTHSHILSIVVRNEIRQGWIEIFKERK